MRNERTGEPVAGGAIFVREATGLVREVSWADAAMYNLIWSSIPLATAFMLLFGTAFYEGGSLYLAVIFCLALTAGMGFLYAMMTGAIPRSGGDYTWITRSVAPPLGLMSNLSWNFWITFFIGLYATFTTAYGLSPLFRLWAARTGSQGLVDLADFLVTRGGVMTVGLIVVFLSGLLLAFGRGLRSFLRLQRWAFTVWFGGAVIIAIVVMSFASADTVTARFNQYVSDLGGPANASSLVLEQAAYEEPAFSLRWSLLMVTLPLYTLSFIFQSVYFGGEVKRGKRSALLAIPGAQALAAVALLLGAFAFLRTAGRPFLASLALVEPEEYGFGFTPLYTELAAVTSGNIVVGSIIIIGISAMLIIFVSQTMLQLSRNIFAWSFDRLLPEKIAEVNPRTRSPIISVLVITVLGFVSVVIVALNPQLTFLVGLFGLTLTYLSVGIAGMLFPYRQPDAFEGSPYNRRVGKIPLITIVGAIAFVTMGAIVTILLLDPNSGTHWQHNTPRVLLGAGVFLAGLPLYYVIRAIRRAQGIDVDLAYREVPPE